MAFRVELKKLPPPPLEGKRFRECCIDFVDLNHTMDLSHTKAYHAALVELVRDSDAAFLPPLAHLQVDPYTLPAFRSADLSEGDAEEYPFNFESVAVETTSDLVDEDGDVVGQTDDYIIVTYLV